MQEISLSIDGVDQAAAVSPASGSGGIPPGHEGTRTRGANRVSRPHGPRGLSAFPRAGCDRSAILFESHSSQWLGIKLSYSLHLLPRFERKVLFPNSPDNTVGRPEVQKFAGALQGKRAKKGVFITTSSFSSEARAYAAQIENKIVLIDGNELADLMIDYNLGISPIAVYEVKRIDSDYFTE